MVSEPALGEIRLQWWHDALASGDGAGHPIATALNQTIRELALPPAAFEMYLDARGFDLDDQPMAGVGELEAHAGLTEAALMQMASAALAGGHDPASGAAAGHAGVAYTLTTIMRTLPAQPVRMQLYLPDDLAKASRLDRQALVGGQVTAELLGVLAQLRSLARRHLANAERAVSGLPAAVRPAFLPLALVKPHLDRMDRRDYDPLSRKVELPAWRRQWILWRAARRAG
jgi:phytoene synthase